MIEAPKSDLLRPAGSSEENNAPVNVDAILLSILGRGAERFGMIAAVLRGERIIAQGAAGVYLCFRYLLQQNRWLERTRLVALMAVCLWCAWGVTPVVIWFWTSLYQRLTYFFTG